MKIVVSGGWGYRNLGDDAILDSTIKLLKQRYDNCDITVLTYDIEDSKIHADTNENVKLSFCAHALVDKGVCNYRFQKINYSYSVSEKIYYKLFDRLVESSWWFERAKKSAVFSELESLIQEADLFIMAGGGYFNEKWLAKTLSHIYELELAIRYDVPFYIIGPTIGSFSPHIADKIKTVFSKAKKISVRDDNSYEEVNKYHDDVKLIPDIALSSWITNEKIKDKKLGVIFTNTSIPLKNKLAMAINKFIKDNPDWRIELYLSRRWKYDFIHTFNLQEELAYLGVNAKICIPTSFLDLEIELASCSVVVSENLHGLILAARNKTPVIAINDYEVGSPNYKKFVAFLKQVKSDSLFINSDSDLNLFVKQLNNILLTDDAIQYLNEFRLTVKTCNLDFMK